MVTDFPARARKVAAVKPAIPPPIIIYYYVFFFADIVNTCTSLILVGHPTLLGHAIIYLFGWPSSILYILKMS
jgi:hypothetical protein